MKVLEATDFFYPWIAGPAPFVDNLSRGLAAHGHELVIACPSPTGSPATEGVNPRLHRVRTWPVPVGYRLRTGAPLIDLVLLVRRWRPDVVHIHHPFPVSVAALTAARLHGVPVLATNHTIPECSLYGFRRNVAYPFASRAMSRGIRAVLERASVVTTPTATAARMLKDAGFGGEVIALSNGIDTARFSPAPSPPSSATVLYTGRLDAEKEVETLIRAVPLVPEQAAVRFRIGGEGSDRARLERLASDLGVSHRVTFTGYVSEAELPEVYRAASLYVMPSPVELQSISTLEALASGLPVVGADSGALPELVKPDLTGLLFPPGDHVALANAIIRLVADGPLMGRLRAGARRLSQQHAISETVRRYEEILAGLTRERLARPVCGPARA